MEWSGKWDWDNLVTFNSKASDSLKKLQLTDWEIEEGGEIDAGSFNLSGSGGCSGGSCSDLAHGSSVKSSISASTNSSPKEEIKTSGFTFEAFERASGADIKRQEPTRAELSGTSSPLEGSVVSVEPLICLKLGKRTYFENNSSPTNTKGHSLSVVPESSGANVKKTKSASQNVSIPLCQVEGCNLDLSSAKEYHRKHRVCDDHSKCPKVIVGGLERRFCQQCSRFHSLSEFDEKKRSCRRRLSDHNARRRKPRQETIQFHSAKLSSSFYGGRQQMNFALNDAKSVGNSTWENMYGSKFTITKDFPFKPGKGGQPAAPAIDLPFAISPHSNSSISISTCKTTSTEVFTQGCKETMFTSSLDSAPELPRALSLLSTNSWVSSEPESISFDQHLHVNPTSMSLPVMPSIPQGLPLGSSDYWQIEQQSTNPQFHNFNSSSNSGGQSQEIQLLKPHYHGIYSNVLD